MWPLKNSSPADWEVIVDNVFTDDQLSLIDRFINQNSYKIKSASITGKVLDTSYRRTDLLWLDDLKGLDTIYKTVDALIHSVNNGHYHWNLDYLEVMQLGIYKAKDQGFYDMHTDSRLSMGSGKSRKLSFSILFSDPGEFDGGDLIMHHRVNGHTVKLQKNQAVFFPSFMPHSVTPVTRGVRKSVVGWVVGPDFV
jgi:PKHD-type hydroxylase